MKNNDVKKYWDNPETESMYDRNLLEIETLSILEHLQPDDTVIDVGCGEGDGTIKYYSKVKELIALDYSKTRLEKLLAMNNKIKTLQMDMKELSIKSIGRKFSKVITQRSLINLQNFEEQKNVIKNIHSILESEGKYIMLEGFNEGVDNINNIRMNFNLPPIEVKWHNHFFRKKELLEFMKPFFALEYNRDFSFYFFTTRVFNAVLQYPNTPGWDSEFNDIAKKIEIKYPNLLSKGLSRLELFVFKKVTKSKKF